MWIVRMLGIESLVAIMFVIIGSGVFPTEGYKPRYDL